MYRKYECEVKLTVNIGHLSLEDYLYYECNMLHVILCYHNTFCDLFLISAVHGIFNGFIFVTCVGLQEKKLQMVRIKFIFLLMNLC